MFKVGDKVRLNEVACKLFESRPDVLLYKATSTVVGVSTFTDRGIFNYAVSRDGIVRIISSKYLELVSSKNKKNLPNWW
jgi:hypothetical protein